MSTFFGLLLDGLDRGRTRAALRLSDLDELTGLSVSANFETPGALASAFGHRNLHAR